MSEIRHIESEADYDATIAKDTPVLVDFTAVWCGPCKALDPILRELSAELDGQVDFVKVDIDDHPEIPARYQVMGVPTMMLFQCGEQLVRMVGGRSKDDLLGTLTALI